MNCDELRDQYELYALGIAEDPEASEIRAHLNRACPTCVPGVRGARELITLIGATAPAAEPPARLRKRVLAAVADAEHSPGTGFRFHLGPRLGAALAAAMVVLVVGGALGVSLALRSSRTGGPAPAGSTLPSVAPSPSFSPLPTVTPHPSPVPTQSSVAAVTESCSAGALTARQYDQDGAAGSSGGDIALRNSGTVTCTLEGYVNLQGVVDGRVTQLGVTHSIGGPLLNNSNGTLPTVWQIRAR